MKVLIFCLCWLSLRGIFSTTGDPSTTDSSAMNGTEVTGGGGGAGGDNDTGMGEGNGGGTGDGSSGSHTYGAHSGGSAGGSGCVGGSGSWSSSSNAASETGVSDIITGMASFGALVLQVMQM